MPRSTFAPKACAMSNIKWNYWVPVLGIAFIMRNPGAYLNRREERLLVLLHMAVWLGAIALLVVSFL